jgi:ribosomal protein L32
MALPKYKRARSRTRSRRAANFLSQIKKPELTRCPKTGEWKRAHFASPSGWYNGRQVFTRRERVKHTEEDQ